MMLEERIALAFSDGMPSSDLQALIDEAEPAAVAAEEAVVRAREHALDPRTTDPAARSALADAEFARDRLQTALPRLKSRHREIMAAEEYRTWRASYDAAIAKQVELARELKQLYQPFEAAIVNLLLRIEKADNAMVAVAFSKPNDANFQPYADGCELVKTEAIARRGGGLSILTDMKLPAWKGSPVPAWPPWRPFGV